jgi:hypothetical protein
MEIPLTVSAPGPLLVTVMVWVALLVPTVWLANVKPAGDSPTAGTAAAPVPVRLTLCGLPTPLSVSVTAATRVPVAAGVNVTVIVHVPFTATDPGHVLVWP